MPLDVLIGAVRPEEREPLREALARRGLRGRVVTNGAEAVAAAAREEPRLVVVDLHLPDLHGIEVARALPDRRTVVLVDPDERALPDLRRLGLEVLVRVPEGPEGLAGLIDRRLGGPSRLAAAVAAERDTAALRARALELVGGDEDRLLRLVLEDPLTHLLTAAYLRRRLEEEWVRHRSDGAPLAVVAGRLGGGKNEPPPPAAEARLAGILLTELGGTALAGREGPGRVLVVLPGCDREAGARTARGLLAAARGGLEGAGPLALGVAAVPDPLVRDAAGLVQAAETALGAAWRAGGGKVFRWVGVEEVGEGS